MGGSLRRVGVPALLVFAVGFVPRSASARCQTVDDLRALRASVVTQVTCAARRILLGPAVACTTAPAPACAGTAVDDMVALVRGDMPDVVAPDATALARQLRCQLAVVRGAASFAQLRGLELARGQRGQDRSRDAFRHVAQRCAVPIAVDGGGVQRPRLGGACASLTAQAGPADGGAIAHCVRPAMEHALQQAISGPLPPNVVVIMTDDQRWDQMEPLPTVRRELGRYGVTFTDSIAPTSLCCPSRASFLSGRLAHHHGVHSNGLPQGGATIFDASQTIAVWLANAGYVTGLFGKYMNDYSAMSPTIPPGWTDWQVFVENADLYYNYDLNENGTPVHYGNAANEYSTDLLAGRVTQFIDAHVAEPFFADFTPFGPHEPAIPAPRDIGAYRLIAPWRPPNYREADVALKPLWVRYARAIQTDAAVLATDQLRIGMLESLLSIDDAAAAILKHLEEHGLTDNTLVIFTSDNSLHLLEHWWRFKNVPYEESIRVPLYVRYPVREPAPAVRHQLAATVDLAPTILDAAGLSTTAPIDGRSLFDAIDGAIDWRSDLLLQHWSGVVQTPDQGVRTSRWKYIHTDGSDAIDQELYDLSVDPWELHNLAYDPAYADVLAALQMRLEELLAQ